MKKTNQRFHRENLEDYIDDLLDGKSLLVINPVNSKSSSYESVTDEIDYTLEFNLWNTPDETSYRRYRWENCDHATFKNSCEGTQFYLVLWPGGNVRACFPKSSTEFPPQLAPVLKRDACYTGRPCSGQEAMAILEKHLEQMKAKLTPEERRHQDNTLAAHKRFSSLQNKVILACIPAGVFLFFICLVFLLADYYVLGCVFGALVVCAIPLALIVLWIFKKKLYERFYREAESADIQAESRQKQN